MQVYQPPGPPMGPPAPYAPPTPGSYLGFGPPPKLPARIRVVVALVIGLSLFIAGATAATIVSRVGRGPAHPEAWDPRVAELAAFVETARGLDFDHPVYVDFLTAEEYEQETTTPSSDLTSEDRDDLANWAAQLRALGLMSGDVDLHEAFNSISSDGTLAFYDPMTQRVTVRGTEMTVGLRVTLVHELTHALQDQHFGIDRQFDTDGAHMAFRALVEGDAVRIENRYIEDISDADAAAYWDEYGAQGDEAAEDLGGVPEAIQVLFGAPYQLGESFVDIVVGTGSQRDLDELFRTPLDSELALIDPGSWLDAEELQEVGKPKLRRGETEVDSGDLGALTLYTMLASRIDPRQATAAVDGWDGDAYVAFEKGDTTCVRFAVAGEDPAATTRLRDALEVWAATLEPATPRVASDGSLVTVLSCDPGTAAHRGPAAGKVVASLTLPVTRSQVMASFLDYGVDGDEARCVGEGVITTFTPDELADPEGRVAESDGFDETMKLIVRGCVDAGELSGAGSASA